MKGLGDNCCAEVRLPHKQSISKRTDAPRVRPTVDLRDHVSVTVGVNGGIEEPDASEFRILVLNQSEFDPPKAG